MDEEREGWGETVKRWREGRRKGNVGVSGRRERERMWGMGGGLDAFLIMWIKGDPL